MSKDKVNLTIEGTSKSGKFLIANIVKRALVEAGFSNVDFTSTSFKGVPISSTSEFISSMCDSNSDLSQSMLQTSICIQDKYPELVMRKRSLYSRQHYVLHDETHDLFDK